MKRLTTRLLVPLAVILLSAGPTQAEPTATPIRLNFSQALTLVAGTIIIPPEWDGVWSIADSVYDCSGTPISTSAELDTLCAGEEITADEGGGAFPVSCSGIANGTTVDVTCSGSGEVSPDCDGTLTLQIYAVRTGETYYATSVTSFTYTGTGVGCDLLEDSCEQVNTSGTRLSPAPSAYCATPVQSSSWGRVKTMYR